MHLDRIVEDLAGAWNDAAADRWAACFTADAIFVDVLGRIQRGRAAIEEEHRKIFETSYRGSRLEIVVLDSGTLDGGFVLAHTSSRLLVPSGPRTGTTDAVQTKVLQGGHITAFQNTIVTAPREFADDDRDLGLREPLAW